MTITERIEQGRKYEVIYADPPWWYNLRLNGNTRFGHGAGYYPLMKTPDICALPVRDLAADRAVLFLWATCPLLPDAFEVIKAWGFRYSTVAFTWVKMNRQSRSPFFGTGFCTKSNAELCLLAWKGRPLRPATNTVSQIVMTHLGEHSRKPDEARQRIELLYPEGRKVELFARPLCPMWPKVQGWDTWGNEMANDVALAGD